MKVIEIGMLAKTHADSGLPEHGIVIEATKEEIKSLVQNVLYNDVELMLSSGKKGESK